MLEHRGRGRSTTSGAADMIGRLARAACIASYVALNVALELLGEEPPDVVPTPETRPPSLREMAADPLAAAIFTEAVDLLVGDGLIFHALTLVYFETALLSPHPDGLQVAMRNDQLLMPSDTVKAFVEGLHAALEAQDGRLLAKTIRVAVDAWDYELGPCDDDVRPES